MCVSVDERYPVRHQEGNIDYRRGDRSQMKRGMHSSEAHLDFEVSAETPCALRTYVNIYISLADDAIDFSLRHSTRLFSRSV